MNQGNILSEYEVSNKVIHFLRHSQTVQREDDGAVHFWKISRTIFRINSHNLSIGLIVDGRHAWQQEEKQKGNQYCTDDSGTVVDFRALEGHSGRNLIDPFFTGQCVIQRGFFQHFYYIGCAFNLHSIINNWIDTWRSEFKKETDGIFFAY